MTEQRSFTCFLCKEVSISTWTEEEKWLEATITFGPKPPEEESVSLCTSCHLAAQTILHAYGVSATWQEPDMLTPLNGLDVRCVRCGRIPVLIDEYRVAVAEDGGTVNPLTCLAYVVSEEGTYNMANGHFACTECYIALGMPTTKEGWKAP